jgi:hypothetical protein
MKVDGRTKIPPVDGVPLDKETAAEIMRAMDATKGKRRYCACGCGQLTEIATVTDRTRGWHKGRPLRWVKDHQNTVHRQRRIDGRSKMPEYNIFLGAKARCENKNHPNYRYWGARGIRFSFRTFEEFMEELGPRPSPAHSVDRIRNDDPIGYAPGNVRWALPIVQVHNRRNSKKEVCAPMPEIAEKLPAY